ncbi:polynucleotide adenylyltransferase PcnB [Natronospira bacteriovora]|uniref:Poly(A) polymerase I n=1 Tax=Natronospira bacteriovora TaxID=3069753 RepID=A0ABU0W5X5_9GAMM|nr:polynucleotide adenylyltransferase PcnB [Natronospira sp. AB-CW4]MDQ2069406.1 polynucleotide adenylyltransferase PcnB [Natronospira sp. AB-CW4]
MPRPQHNVSRQHISDNALKVLHRLNKAGFEAYIVGGGVRDLLLGGQPKDFDVATNARPEEVRELFRNCRLIGRRFRLAHVLFGPEVIEVATFRALSVAEDDDRNVDDSGMILRDNVYGSMEEDAFRRDFTINALYYGTHDFAIVDYVGGMEDIERRSIRLIGDPEERYREDPVRMLRAVRFAAKLDFDIAPTTEAPLQYMGDRLEDIPPARLFDEYLKLFLSGQALKTFEKLHQHGLFGMLFPHTVAAFDGEQGEVMLAFVRAALANTDRRVAENKPVTPAFLIAAFLWGPIQTLAARLEVEGNSPAESLQLATRLVMERQQSRVSVPRRFGLVAREMILMQPRLERNRGRRAMRLLGHPRFRAAYDLLVLRATAGDAPRALADFWTEVQNMDERAQEEAFQVRGGGRGPRKKRRRRRKNPAAGQS